jgi:hypothetical protein
LALCEPPYPLPDKGGLNYDNSGENKVWYYRKLLMILLNFIVYYW